MTDPRIHILLTNDDGIQSPGLWAAAQALAALGFVHVVAPREQASGTGRSMPASSDGVIKVQEVVVNRQPWTVYAVGGTPAQAVQHALLEILPQKPDLAVSGINYGENIGTAITISGTVGAALEAAAFGIPALAVSLETDPEHHYSLSEAVDFSAAAHFTAFFARLILAHRLPPDVDLLKVDVPCDASPQTPWRLTRLTRRRYFEPIPPQRSSWETPAKIGYLPTDHYERDRADSDAYVLRVRRQVSVTPLSLDLTARVNLSAYERALRRMKVGERGHSPS